MKADTEKFNFNTLFNKDISRAIFLYLDNLYKASHYCFSFLFFYFSLELHRKNESRTRVGSPMEAKQIFDSDSKCIIQIMKKVD